MICVLSQSVTNDHKHTVGDKSDKHWKADSVSQYYLSEIDLNFRKIYTSKIIELENLRAANDFEN